MKYRDDTETLFSLCHFLGLCHVHLSEAKTKPAGYFQPQARNQTGGRNLLLSGSARCTSSVPELAASSGDGVLAAEVSDGGLLGASR